MTFDFWGFTRQLFFTAPAGPHGYAILLLFAATTAAALLRAWRSFRGLAWRRWLAFLALLAAGFALGQLFILRIPANILPPPGLPAESARPGLALFALLPVFLAGALGTGPAIVVGLATGFSRAAWETYSLATPFEYALIGGAAAWLMQQDYRGWPGRLLRHPFAAALTCALVLWALIIPANLAYSAALDLPAWDYVASLTQAEIPVFAGQILLAGLLAELVRLGAPGWWPQRQGLVAAPYVASLNRKLLFSLIPTFLVGVVLLLWAIVSMAISVSTNLMLDQMATAAGSAGHGIPYFVQTGQSVIVNIADEADWLALEPAAQTARLAQSLRTMPFFSQLTLLDADLRPVAGYPAAPADLAPLPAAEIDVARVALGGVAQNDTLYPEAGREAVAVMFAAPLTGAEGAARGVLVGRAVLSETPLMRSVIANLDGLADGAGQAFIVDEHDAIIYHPDADRLLETFRPEPSGARLRTRLAGAQAYQDKGPDGTRRLVLYYPVPGHRWSVVALVPNHVVLALATEISSPVIAILLIIGMVGLLLVSLIATRLTQPAEALARAARRLSEGGLDEPVVVDGEDEIGRAGLAFEQMRQKLRARLEELGLLLRVSQHVAGSLKLEAALPPILEGALSATGAAGARLVLLPPESAAAAISQPPALQVFMAGPAAAVMAPLDRGVLQLTREEGLAVLENVARARAVLDVALVAGHLPAVVALPLRHEANYLGALWLAYDQPHAFGDSEVNFLTTLAGQAAVAVANARLFEAAEQGRQRLAAILASTADAVIVTDRNERLLLLNPAAEQAFGLAGKPAIGRPVAQVLPDAELVKLLQDHRPDGAPAAGEFAVTGGKTLYASASSIIGADTTVLGRVCVLRDVTRFKELDQMKSDFVATVSHDLRAPLTFMRGYATMLPMVGGLNDKQQEFADKIISGIEQMTVLIDDLLDLGRIEAGVDLAREPVQMATVINEVALGLAPHAASRGVQLQVEAPPDLPPLSGDPTLLRQAVTNLLDNAVKYTPAGGHVRLRAVVDDGQCLVSVTDTGVGIAPADQAHLFEKFFRVRQRGSTQVKGSGLGLAIVKSIAERHGGRVWVDSKLGRGSTFYLAVPLHPAA